MGEHSEMADLPLWDLLEMAHQGPTASDKAAALDEMTRRGEVDRAKAEALEALEALEAAVGERERSMGEHDAVLAGLARAAAGVGVTVSEIALTVGVARQTLYSRGILGKDKGAGK